MLKKPPLTAAFVIASALLVVTQPLAAAEQRFITIGTGGVTGVYYPAGGAICRLVNKDRKIHGIRCSAESTDGSAYNLKAIRSGDIDMGVMQSDVQYNAYHGSGKFSDSPPYTELRSILSLHHELFTVVARADANIKRFSDLKGKRVNIGNPGSGQRMTMEVLMDAKGWDTSTFAPASELKSSRQPSALCQDKIDAMIFTVGHPNDSIKQATDSCDSKLIEVSDAAVNQLVTNHRYYQSASIPGGMYRGNSDDTASFSVGATVVTAASSSDEVIYRVVKSIFENFDNFKQLHPALAQLKKQQMISDGLTAPLHPGAIKYYKEAGLM